MFNFFKKEDSKVVNVNEVDSLGKINLIDIREVFEYKSGAIKGSKNIPMGELLGNPEKYLKKDNEYYIMCQSGARSSRACSKLKSAGYNAINVKGGMGGYRGENKK